jgi:hypothetical protein
MKHFAVVDDQGFPTAFYNDQIHKQEKIPKEAVEITEADWLEFINNSGERKLVDGVVTKTEQREPVRTWDDIRQLRNQLLTQSDWTMLADAPVDRDAWVAYRQKLRDLTDEFERPNDVIWPTKP